MKRLNHILLIAFLALALGSCKKYLTPRPKTEMTRDELFSTEAGFRDALAGVYIQLMDDAAYGKAMTMTTMENLVSSWDVTANSAAYRLGLFDYEDAGAEAALANIFGQLYKIIAGINAMLEQVDAKKGVFSPGMYELVKGECLALRAWCHFDLLRLFGPVPSNPEGLNQLPYVKTVSKLPNPPISFTAFKTALLNDLSEAEMLLKDVDPFVHHSIADFKTGGFRSENELANYRYLRMNFYAVKALQARAYLWFNDHPRAYDCAKFVIDAQNPAGGPKFRLGNATDMAGKDYGLTCEHIFGLYDFALFTKYNQNFAGGNLRKGSDPTSIRNLLYGNTGTDIREANLWETITISSISSYILKKYQVVETPANLLQDFKQIPLLRISEMYLIAIETGEQSEAQALWNMFRAARNLVAAALPSDPQQKQVEIIKEYRKEFYGEGQAFFAYKRTNTPKANFLFAPVEAVVNYVPPMPKTETTTR